MTGTTPPDRRGRQLRDVDDAVFDDEVGVGRDE
jgi:hypothetical protein